MCGLHGSKGKDETHFQRTFSNIFSSQKSSWNKTLNISFGKNRLSTTKTPSILLRLSIPNNTFDEDDAFDPGMSLSSTPTFVVVFFVEWCAFDARENDDDVYDFVVVDVIFFGRSGKSTKPTPKDDDDEKNANWCGRNAPRKDENARDDDDENLERVRRVVVDIGRRRRRRNFGEDDEGECTTFGKATV